MTRLDIYQLLDGMSETPRAANLMLSVLRTLIEWGVKRGYRADNPAIGVKPLKLDDSGHHPWPEAGYSLVMKAPVHLRRLAYLGRATGQRVSDLVKMRPADLTEDGINLRIGKLRDKPHMVPLTKAQMAEIKSWGVRDLDFFITTPSGKRCTETYLNKLWVAWRESEDAIGDGMTINGLRATKIRDLRHEGAADGAIADELGMSVNMVSRYLRFDNKVASARLSRDRRERKQTAELLEFENPNPDLKTLGS
jgi:integrase